MSVTNSSKFISEVTFNCALYHVRLPSKTKPDHDGNLVSCGPSREDSVPPDLRRDGDVIRFYIHAGAGCWAESGQRGFQRAAHELVRKVRGTAGSLRTEARGR